MSQLHPLVTKVKSMVMQEELDDKGHQAWARILCGDEEFAWLGDNFFNTVVRWHVLQLGQDKKLGWAFQRTLASKIHSKKLMCQLAVWIGLVDEMKIYLRREAVSTRSATEALEACLGYMATHDKSGNAAMQMATELIDQYWNQIIEYIFRQMLCPDDLRLIIFTVDPGACILEQQQGCTVITRVQKGDGTLLPYVGQGKSTASSRSSLFNQILRRQNGYVEQTIELLSKM